MDPGFVALFVMAGLSQASILFIVAAGLSLVFGALRVINMAHGSLYMIGAFLTTAVVGFTAGHTLGFWAALLVAPLAAAVIGGLIEILVLKRLYGEEHLLQLLGTYALTLVFAGAIRLIFGSENLSIAPPPGLRGSVLIVGHSYPVYRIFLMGAALVIALGLYLLLYRTGLGRNIRAAVSDPELLSAAGINVSRLFTTVFMIGTLLAGLGGALVAPSQAVTPDIDTEVLVSAFAISVIGGLGSLLGSFVGALVVGLMTSFAIAYPPTSRWSVAFIFVAMAAVLTIRPWGLFGRPEA
jgi:branched-subunit amino acid ABC-type transport system permease component